MVLVTEDRGTEEYRKMLSVVVTTIAEATNLDANTFGDGEVLDIIIDKLKKMNLIKLRDGKFYPVEVL